LEKDGLVDRTDGFHLTAPGKRTVAAARKRLAKEQDAAMKAALAADDSPSGESVRPPMLVAGVITAPLRAGGSSAPTDPNDPIPVMIELNLRYRSGPKGAFAALRELWKELTDGAALEALAEEYATGSLSPNQLKCLVAADAVPITWPDRAIYRVWPDFPVTPQIDASVITVKADAAHRAFNADGSGIVWAVIDSGIDGSHPHFAGYGNLTDPAVKDLHRDFTGQGDPTQDGALVDEDGHGTHVAGIIAGGLTAWGGDPTAILVTENRYNADNPAEPLRQPRTVTDPTTSLEGVAPRARLVSLKVLGGGGPLESRVSRVIRALAYVREINAGSERLQRIHGVNLSLGYDFRPEWFACGSSPLCQEVNKLVRTGVVVVVAAGNSGYGTLNVIGSDVKAFGMAMTINDPGNAQGAITVGSTHRDAPHAYGVSYFSSKGPTGDGRMKPDLVAPGERITSAGAGRMRAAVSVPAEITTPAVYVEESGTSMAAPHVSGAAAAFLSVRHEFIGRPEELKEILVSSATSLGRERSFEGAGLVDLMRALQSV
jgi:subtilisin family serine protease